LLSISGRITLIAAALSIVRLKVSGGLLTNGCGVTGIDKITLITADEFRLILINGNYILDNRL
jgi:hypothetical protein